MNPRRFAIPFLAITLLLTAGGTIVRSEEYPVKRILILVEGTSDLKNLAMGDGRQLAELMGHFSTSVTIQGVNSYVTGEVGEYDRIFYVGFNPRNSVPARFLDDIMRTPKAVIWLGTGFPEFCRTHPVAKQYGFVVTSLDSTSGYDEVVSGGKVYAKGEPTTGLARITNSRLAEVLAIARVSKKGKETPYIIRSGNLLFFADSPFASAGDADRYLLFADMLHEILDEEHETSHTAIIRIEDVDPLEDPDKLREVADLLSSKGIPFLVGVIPFYVDPGEGIRVSMSDKPNFVDALQYMVKNGGTIVMHGITHQYKGTTAVDYEFWDESTNGPIRDETAEGDARKIEMGIQECMKNGIYPLVWETPHYTASFTLYKTIAKYFSTACEQRLAIENADYSQYFPYVIHHDLFGQTIYPEDLGYVPLNPDKEASLASVHDIVKNAKAILNVRDGVAGVFFHPFLDLDLLRELVDGLQGLGYTFLDLREQKNIVKTKDRVILSGSQSYTITLNDQYLAETYFDQSGAIRERTISEKRFNGPVTKAITLAPGEFYKAEPTEFRERQLSLIDRMANTAERVYDRLFSGEEEWQTLRPVILWNQYAKGAAFNDQSSFASVFASVNVRVDTIFIGQRISLAGYNLAIVPGAFVDSLAKEDYDVLTGFVSQGGNLITDTKNDVAEELGIHFLSARMRVARIRDRYFPEEQIVWLYPELVTKFETEDVDEVFCIDEVTEAPMVVGKRYGKGKVLYINSPFDARSQEGYSQYPYLLEYVRKYFGLRPFIRRENLEVYFDPGFRHAYSIEQLVQQWVRQGVRIIHAAGWHEYPKYTYDYARLVRLAHANGILVYAWLEPPQVSQKFWTDHPEWREKNYRGEDVRPSWRYPVALTDPKCVAAMVQEYRDFLQRYDWDGVNLAELYFESGRGLEDPKVWTPMHPTARAEIRKRYGFDPLALFDPKSQFYWKSRPDLAQDLTDYRIGVLHDVYHRLLDMTGELVQSRPGFEVIVTALDSYGSPELRDYLGVDMTQILKLRKEYGFSLQVEDPEDRWSTDPRRYIDIGKRYASLVGDSSRVLIDLNILQFRKKDVIIPFPTLIQTGTESFQLVRSAAIGAPRLTIYSESSVNPQDMSFLANALAAGTSYHFTPKGFDISAPASLVLKMPKNVQELAIDGTPVPPFRDNLYMIPAGEHAVEYGAEPVNSFSTHQLKTRLMSISGILLAVEYGMRDVSFSYASETRTLASFSNLPTAVTVDGKDLPVTAMKGNDCYTILLPAGRHEVNVTAGDQFSYGVNVTSLWSTTAIAMFGAAAVSLLLLMYFALKFIKRSAAGRA